ncbi:MAG: cytochrome ubiquinol oxidase subunit I [Elusimicrobiota bacterium]
MDVLFLSRLQFAVTAAFHFLFVPMTLGVVVLVAFMQTLWYKTGEEYWLKLTKFFGKLFLINFAIGVVTGISLEFQFGMNWSAYSKYVGDIFGVPLAIEATAAFFLESVFLGLWIFGWDKISKRVHLLSIWLVAIGSNLSALWILFANAFMQNPVGYKIAEGRVELTDFAAFMLNPYAWVKFFHTIFAAYCVGAFFVMGISAYHILKKRNVEAFSKSFKLASYFCAFSALMVFVFGDFHAKDISKYQPSKFAAMESVWETQKGAGYPILVLPDESGEKNTVEALKIPYMLSILATYDPFGEVKGLKEFPKEDRPPVFLTFASFRAMVGLGFLFIALSLLSVWLSWKNKLENPIFLKIMIFSIPLPYLAMQLGWIVAEVGRQPWAVYGLLKTAQAVSPNLSVSQVLFSLAGYFIVYSFLGFAGFYLMFKNAVKGIEN